MEESQTTPKAPQLSTPEAVGNKKSKYSIVVYNAEEIRSFDCHNIDELLKQADPSKVNWVTVRDVHNEEELFKLLNYFNVDQFLLPDILDEGQMEFEAEYENCLYLEYMVPYLDETYQALVQSKGSFILTSNVLILYEHQLHGLFSRMRRRALNRQTHIMEHGPDYLLYLLIRAVIVEHFQHGFKHLTVELEELEDYVLEGRGREDVYQVILAKREGIKPWNEPLLELEDFLEYIKDAESKFITEEIAKYFTKSLLREIETLLEYYDRLRLLLKEVMDLHMGNIERNTGRVNQLLTIIATIFLPITFIASIYGMNFEYMPELKQPWGYPAVLILMAAVALGLILFMKRRRWF
jgi:magnesium transporter